MIRPTDDLRTEHALSAQVASTLAGIRRHVAEGGQFPVADVAEVLRFLRDFLVGVHFRKENEHVWPAVAMHGSGDSATAVGELMGLQAEAAELIGSLVFLWEPLPDLTPIERASFVDTVAALLERLRQMAAIEDPLLVEFDRSVPGDDQVDLAALCRAAGSRGNAQSWRSSVAYLARRWASS
ncbi:MAG: hemerythrin domain-containing protein [Planctomycetota bacterium]